MRIVLSLVKRNLRIYRRDRAGVLLSLLAALMLLLIYALFLGAIQADSLKAKLPSADLGGRGLLRHLVGVRGHRH